MKLPANPAVDKAEAEFKSALADAKKLKDLWARLDYNGNGKGLTDDGDKEEKRFFWTWRSKPLPFPFFLLLLFNLSVSLAELDKFIVRLGQV